MTKIITFCAFYVLAVIFFIWKYQKEYRNGKSKVKQNVHHKHGESFSIDIYAYASHIKNWNVGFKVGFSVIILVLSIALDDPYVSVSVIYTMAYITVIKGGLSFREYLSIITIPLSFILLGTFAIAVDFSKEPIGQYNISLGYFYIFTSWDQIKKMLLLILKVFAAVSALQTMTLSTPSHEIIMVLRKIYIPKLFIELMNLIYRFIFIILDVYRQMKNSAEARGGYVDFKTSCITFGNIASNMLVVSLQKSDVYYNAMEARCYEGDLQFLDCEKKTEKNQLIAAAGFILFLFLLWGFM